MMIRFVEFSPLCTIIITVFFTALSLLFADIDTLQRYKEFRSVTNDCAEDHTEIGTGSSGLETDTEWSEGMDENNEHSLDTNGEKDGNRHKYLKEFELFNSDVYRHKRFSFTVLNVGSRTLSDGFFHDTSKELSYHFEPFSTQNVYIAERNLRI